MTEMSELLKKNAEYQKMVKELRETESYKESIDVMATALIKLHNHLDKVSDKIYTEGVIEMLKRRLDELKALLH